MADPFLLDASRRAHRRQGGLPGGAQGRGSGFAGPTSLKAGELMKQLVDLQPFQNGFLGFKNPQALGFFGDGKAAMALAISSHYITQRSLSASKQGVTDDKIGWFNFPTVPGGKGEPTDTLGGINGWLVTKGAEAGGGVHQVLYLEGQSDQAGPGRLPDPDLQGSRGRPGEPVPAEYREEHRRLAIPPELLRPGSRPQRRPGRQRRDHGDRWRQHDAAAGREGHPGRLQDGQTERRAAARAAPGSSGAALSPPPSGRS